MFDWDLGSDVRSSQLPCPVPKWSAKLPKALWVCSIRRMGGRAMAHVPAWSPCPCQISLGFWIFRLKLSYVKIRARLTHILAISWHILTFLNARSVNVSWLIKWFLCLCLEDPQCPLCVPFRKRFWSLNSLFRSCFWCLSRLSCLSCFSHILASNHFRKSSSP